jgi:hypothetical protein
MTTCRKPHRRVLAPWHAGRPRPVSCYPAYQDHDEEPRIRAAARQGAFRPDVSWPLCGGAAPRGLPGREGLLALRRPRPRWLSCGTAAI